MLLEELRLAATRRVDSAWSSAPPAVSSAPSTDQQLGDVPAYTQQNDLSSYQDYAEGGTGTTATGITNDMSTDMLELGDWNQFTSLFSSNFGNFDSIFSGDVFEQIDEYALGR